MTAWFLFITLCASATTCAEVLAPGAPFYDEESCLVDGYDRAARLLADGFVQVGWKCEELPLER